jgi:DNA gyrase subunit A
MGVVFAKFADEDKILAIAKNSERNLEATAEGDEEVTEADSTPETPVAEEVVIDE